MLAFLLDALPELRPDMHVEAYGLDVSDAGVQEAGFFDETRRTLAAVQPSVEWDQRLTLITTNEPWPYPSGTFDFILSNQVLEHVRDQAFVFREIRRCLAPGGVSINLFPVREVLFEGHALMPVVHRIRSVEARERAMLIFARLGFRRHFHRDKERRGWQSLEEFAAVFSRVLETDTNYVPLPQHRATARECGLEASFEYTKDFYIAKVLSYLGRRTFKYRASRLWDWMGLHAGKRISCVTMSLRSRPVGPPA